MERLEAVVTGRVQGVGFRRYAARWARRLGLAGWVCNAPDGTVRLAAEGPPAALDRFVRLLHGGPPGASVERVGVQRSEATSGEPAPFELRR